MSHPTDRKVNGWSAEQTAEREFDAGATAPGDGAAASRSDLGDTDMLESRSSGSPGEHTRGYTGPTATPPAPGEVFGDYELLEEIARGGMGVVYKARQRSLDRTVALKMILDRELNSENAVRRFRQEAQAAAGLDHPNIVPIYEIGEQAGRHYFTMALIDGSSLSALIKKHGALATRDAVALLIPVAEAVAYAHERNIIHRDLKPDNVLIDGQGRPRVTDFGLAKRIEGDARLTGTGQILGTPSYMAPEQALAGNRPIGPAADVYALGGILYCMLTGKPPFSGATFTEVLVQVVGQQPTPPTELNADVPPALEAICLRCLQKAPADRYPSVPALLDDLRAWAVSPGPAVEQPPPSPPAPRPAPARKGIRTVVGMAAMLLVVVGVAVYLGLTRMGEANPDGASTRPEQVRPVASKGSTEPEEVPPPAGDPLRKEFGLKVKMLDAQSSPNGVLQLPEGSRVQFRIEVDRDAYVGLWTIDPKGNILQIFPNEHDKDHELKANQPRMVPNGDYVFEAALSTGVEQIRVFASSKRWDPVDGEREGPYEVFKSLQDREKWQRHQRGIRIRPVGMEGSAAFAEEVLNYRVRPRR